MFSDVSEYYSRDLRSFSTIQNNAVGSSETAVDYYRTAWGHVPFLNRLLSVQEFNEFVGLYFGTGFGVKQNQNVASTVRLEEAGTGCIQARRSWDGMHSGSNQVNCYCI
jgi:hypothetical protein